MPQTWESDGFGEKLISVGRSHTNSIHQCDQGSFVLTSCEVHKDRTHNLFQEFYIPNLPGAGGLDL